MLLNDQIVGDVMKKGIVFKLIPILFLLISCSSGVAYSQSNIYVSEAKKISSNYGLADAKISFGVLQEFSDSAKTIYSLKIISDDFSNLSDDQKYLYLYDLEQIIADADYKVSVVIISRKIYQLSTNFEQAFSENNNPIFPYGTPTGIPDDRLIFNPPVEIELISTNPEFGYILAGDTVHYLTEYERYSVKDNNSPTLRRIFDDGYAFYISDGPSVMLMEIDDGFAKVKLIEQNFHKGPGYIGWIHLSNVKSYPKP